MTHEGLISAAQTRGILTAPQAEDLRRLAAELGGAELPAQDAPGEIPTSPDDEKLRLITGFADIFVTLGLGLFLAALTYFGANLGQSELTAWPVVAVASWLLAEFFTRRRRMALPSIVLLAVFAGAVFASLLTFAGHVRGEDAALENTLAYAAEHPWAAAAAALGTSLLTALHYWRFHVPITVAAGVVALAGAIFAGLLAAAPEVIGSYIESLIFLLGLAVFALAMYFDMSDRARATRRTDIAFWLHLAAAPMIVHPLFAGIGGGLDAVDPSRAGLILAAFLLLGLIAVIIDRRAMLVSGLIYAAVACVALLRTAGATDFVMPATLLALGAFILLLSAGWHPLRRLLLRVLPAPITLRLPDPVTAS
ncbi:hypothetical protein ACFQU1_01805 [Chelatococcus sp. GCM10030263]|uniref:hypothetical protein n=1 Tax=Chelatococcus sp. GCM10030263 TaxID=3273387 RepID=UPI00360F167F